MNLIRNFFVPTARNGDVPFALSRLAFLIYLLLAALLAASPLYLRGLQLALLSTPANYSGENLIDLANAARRAAGLAELKENPVLTLAAYDRAEDMLVQQYFAHLSPDQRTPWDFLRARNYSYLAAGENLATDYPTALDAHAGWMNSPTHRANILNPAYTEIGIAVVQGELLGHPSILAIQYFGKPRSFTLPLAALGETKAAQIKPAVAGAEAAESNGAETSAAEAAGGAAADQPVEKETAAGAEETAAADSASGPAVPAATFDTEPSPTPSLLTRLAQVLCPCIQFTAIVAVLTILTALAFLWLRTSKVPPPIAFRGIVLLALFGYLFLFGSAGVYPPAISPTAATAFELPSGN